MSTNKIWFTADWHFYHKNIIKYCDRPFKNVERMNNTIIKNYHATVNEDDTVFVLGDITMRRSGSYDAVASILMNMPGNKHLILGNHDKLAPLVYHEYSFQSVHTTLELDFEGEHFYLVHDPALVQIHNALVIHGHVHQHWRTLVSDKTNSLLINVGVDVNEFTPISLEEILALVKLYKGGKST